jgi:hypothetical protein
MRIAKLIFIMAAVCVALGAPFTATAGSEESQVAGRWHDGSVRDAKLSAEGCEGSRCGLTLDIVRCADAWCGIEVTAAKGCGGTALKVDAGTAETGGGLLFSGTLELAKGSEPYTVQAYLQPANAEAPARLFITGDTGGEFRMFRRSFPFHASLARIGEAECRLEKPVG